MNILINKKQTTLIIPKTINFKELINNTLTLSPDAKSEMIDFINSELNEQQQQIYVRNLYMCMNFDPTTDFPVNLDHVYKDMGFANKGNAMKTIKSNFTKNEDYKILLVPTEKQVYEEVDEEIVANKPNEDCSLVRREKRTNRGGNNHETIMLNIDTYKTLCMLVKTPQGKEIRRYYVKLENIYNSIIKKEIENKDKLLEEKDQQLTHVTLQLEKLSKFKIKKWYNQLPGDIIYAIKSNNGIIKVGKTKNIKERESYYLTNQVGDMFYIKKCFNCDLAEKVVHHILDKHRIESNKEWFEISNELAIYTIDMVCDFLDKFINCSERLTETDIREQLLINVDKLEIKNNEKVQEKVQEKVPEKIQEKVQEKKEIKKEIKENKKEDVCNQENKELISFEKFVKECCEIAPENKCLTIDMLGAYRLYIKNTNSKTRSNLTKYLDISFTTQQHYCSENRTLLKFYIGIKPKELSIKQETEISPYYEQFILSECKFGYTYRTTKKIIMTEFDKWHKQKYTEYIFTKDDKMHFESYLSRNFYNCLKIHLNGGCNGYYGVQMKDDDSVNVGINLSNAVKVDKINIETNETETFESVSRAAYDIKYNIKNLTKFINQKTIVNGKFLFKYNSEQN